MCKGSQKQTSSCSSKAAIDSRREILFTYEISHRLQICMHTKLKVMHACYKNNLTYEAKHKHTHLTEKCATSWLCPLVHLLHTCARVTNTFIPDPLM